MFGRKKGKDDADDEEEEVAEELPTRNLAHAKRGASEEPARSKRHARAEEKSVRVETPSTSTPLSAIEAEWAKLADKLREANETVQRDRAGLLSELESAKQANANLEQEAAAQVTLLRSQLAEREESLRLAHEEAASLRRRLEGFEGLKQAMQNL